MALGEQFVVGAQILGIGLASVVTVVTWRRRHVRGALTLAVFSTGVVVWSGSQVATRWVPYGIEILLTRVSYLGISVFTLGIFLFALEYSGRRRLLTRRLIAVLVVVPVMVQALLWGGWQSQFFVAPGPSEGIEYVHGVGFWVHALYSYALVFVGLLIFLEIAYRRQGLYRLQSAAVAASVAVPLGADLTGLAVTTAAFSVTGAILALAIFRADLVDVMPIARSTVFANVRVGVVVFDRRDRVIEINPVGRQLLNLDGSAPIGAHASDVFATYPGLWEYLADVREGREQLAVNTDGGRRTFLVRISQLDDHRGRPVGRVVLLDDITRQKRRQRALERKNEYLDEFASIVSHELRNPLSVANGYVRAAREADSLVTVREYLDAVDGAHQRMDEMIDAVLEVVRQDDIVTETAAVELDAIARSAWSRVDTRNATLTVETPLEFYADEQRLLHVFENLFRNSVEHGSDDVRVTVGSIDRPADTGDRLREPCGFYVADDGPGIPADKRELIFDHGFTTVDDGFGLGLSVVESVVDAHGWDIVVTDSEEGGARFEIVGVRTTETTTVTPAPID